MYRHVPGLLECFRVYRGYRDGISWCVAMSIPVCSRVYRDVHECTGLHLCISEYTNELRDIPGYRYTKVLKGSPLYMTVHQTAAQYTRVHILTVQQ